MMLLRGFLLILMMDIGKCQEVLQTMAPSIDSDISPDSSSHIMDTLLPDHPDLRHSGYSAQYHKDNGSGSFSESAPMPPSTHSTEVTTIEAMPDGVRSNNTSNMTTSISLDPSITDQLPKATLGHATETLSSALQPNPPTDSDSDTFASSFHISNSLETDFVAHSHSTPNMNSTAELLSADESTRKNHTNNFSRFSHHSMSTLSLDLLSFVSAILSTQPLVTTAQTITSHPDVSMTTPDIMNSPTAASQFDDVTFTSNATSAAADIPAEESHNTSNVRLSTMIPRLLSAATQVDSSLPSGGLDNETLTAVTPGEKSTHLTEGSIAGIVLGCLAAIFTFSILMLCFCYKQKKMGTLSPKKKKKKKTSHYTGLFDDGITLSYINCQFEPTKDPIDEMASLDNDAYLNSLEQYMVNQTWLTKAPNTPITNL